MPKLVFSARAEEDLYAIFAYTAETWSKTQAEKYTRELHKSCVQCGAQGYVWAAHKQVAAPYESRIIGKHVAIFYVHDDLVEVLAILHQSMNIPARISEILGKKP